MLIMISVPHHPWMAVALPHFWFPECLYPCQEMFVCLILCVTETEELQLSVHWLVLILSLPKACLKGKWHDLVFHSSLLLFYYPTAQIVAQYVVSYAIQSPLLQAIYCFRVYFSVHMLNGHTTKYLMLYKQFGCSLNVLKCIKSMLVFHN